MAQTSRDAARPLPAAAAGLETPLFFASGDRPLYGLLHAPRLARPDAPVVVCCHSLGVEQVTLYRPEVNLARAAAALGFPVFRYHARGHGDSGGDFADVTLDHLTEDALAAADEARRRTGAARIAWLGGRFGALVAARAAVRTQGSAALGLWEPVYRPRDYFRAQLRGYLFSQVAGGKRPDATVDQLLEKVRTEGKVDVHGYYIHRAIVDSSAGEDLGRLLESWSAPTLLAQIEARPRLSPAHAALVGSLEQRGVAVETLRVAEEPGWHFIANPAWENQTLVKRTAEWLDALA